MEFVLIKGAGDLATGVALAFVNSGYPVMMTEIHRPTCVRRRVSFATAIYEGEIVVEGTKALLAQDFNQALAIIQKGQVAVLADPRGTIKRQHVPQIFIEATLAKRNTDTTIHDAPVVVALGPGFTAGVDAHVVMETMRGPGLGQPIYQGTAIPNTGIPGLVLGYTSQRVLRAPAAGLFTARRHIGDVVRAGDTVAVVGHKPIQASINGIVRGLLKDGLTVKQHMKVGDIHPAHDPSVCYQVTDKAKTIGRGTVLAAQTILSKQQTTSAI